MALKMILEKGAQLVKVCADLPRNTMRLLTGFKKLGMKVFYIYFPCLIIWLLFELDKATSFKKGQSARKEC